MSRRSSSAQEVFRTTSEKVEKFAATPLREISDKLSLVLEQGHSAFQSKKLSGECLEQLCTYIGTLIGRLPQSFGERFFFDAVLLRALARDWSNTLTISGMFMPRYDENWGHLRLMMPSEDEGHAHMVDLIHMPGHDRIEDINLLSYPWLAHEWGHCVMLRHDSSFSPYFLVELNKTITSLRLASIADRGSAKVKAQQTIEELARLWSPCANENNWAHELAIDLLSLWTCGPAYLACFEDHLVDELPDPYLIDQGHPPYAVRVQALIEGAKQIGLKGHTNGLSGVVATWDKSKWYQKKDNHFLALARPELIEACIRVAFGACKCLSLTVCSPKHVEAAQSNVVNSGEEDFGLDLLLMARTVFNEKGEEAYNVWEHGLIARLITSIRP